MVRSSCGARKDWYLAVLYLWHEVRMNRMCGSKHIIKSNGRIKCFYKTCIIHTFTYARLKNGLVATSIVYDEFEMFFCHLLLWFWTDRWIVLLHVILVFIEKMVIHFSGLSRFQWYQRTIRKEWFMRKSARMGGEV